MRVEGATALAWRRGRYAGLRALKGPRPAPLDLGPTSATFDDFADGPHFGPDFRTRARLHSLDDAFLVMGEGNDGGVMNGGRELVMELCAFAQMGQRARPFELGMELREEVLENVCVGVDGSSRNYYHWLVNALGRARLCAEAAPGYTVALPDFRADGDRPGQVRPAVLEASAAALLGPFPCRLLAPGVYRVRGLHVLWTRPTAPTDISGIARLYTLFDSVSEQIAGAPARRPRRRLYLARRSAHDPRIPASDVPALEKVLHRHGFETLAPEDLSFEAQVCAAAAAEVIVAPHGAGLTNLLFSPHDAVVIELVSRIGDEAKFRPWYYQLASGRGQRYGAIKVEDADWPAALDRALTRCLR